MDMFDGVGRRLDESTGQLINIGAHSLNGRERKVLFRNNGDGTFTDVAFVNGVDLDNDGRGLTIFDYDRNGRLDIALRNYRQPAQLLRNRGGAGHWIKLRLVGTQSNRDAVGARIRLRTDRAWQTRVVTAGSAYLSAQSLVQHFGLGPEERIDELVISWPSGTETRLENLDADRYYVVNEGEGAGPDGKDKGISDAR